MKVSRRRLLYLATAAAAIPAVSRVAQAQAYPPRPVKMIVPFAAGGPTDVAARVASEHMSRTLGQQLIVENVVGAGGTIGSLRAMRGRPDGYTIQMGHVGTHAISIPFGGNAPAMTALLGGQVDYFMATILDIGPYYGRGTVKIYAIGAAERNPALPSVPTTREVGLPNLDASPWWALFAPKGTPRPVLDKLSDALDKALDEPNTRRRLLELGAEIPEKAKRGRQALAVLVKSDIARWTPIIKAANLAAE